ncbi:MAG: M48 family metallopeptidase [Candidatus Marinimicrobia bacterium]|nr:M48 family metallopeptidase [Candidatus Neomarinimicrobiota bacterium]
MPGNLGCCIEQPKAKTTGGRPYSLRPAVAELRRRSMKTRRGSCLSQGRITLSAHLIRLSKRRIDYVITHELCHLKFPRILPTGLSLLHHRHLRRSWKSRLLTLSTKR